MCAFLSWSAPTLYPQNVRGEGRSPAALTISWEPLKPINHNGPGLYYIVYYQKTDGTGRPERKEVKRASTYNVLGVDYYTQYKIQLQAANDIGFGPKTQVVFAYSGERGKKINSFYINLAIPFFFSINWDKIGRKSKEGVSFVFTQTNLFW